MAGSESLKTSITLGPVSFKDNVDGVIPISKVKVTKNFHNSIQPVGEYKETFAVKDSHANWVNCKVQITVRGMLFSIIASADTYIRPCLQFGRHCKSFPLSGMFYHLDLSTFCIRLILLHNG